MWIGRHKWEWLKERARHLEHCWQVCQDGLRHESERRRNAEDVSAGLSEECRVLRTRLAAAEAAIREADLLRSRVNALELERATLLVRLLPGLKLQVPQLGKLDLSIGAPGTDFEDLGDLAGASGDHPDQIPIPATLDPATIADLIGETDEPALQRGTVVGGRRPPEPESD